MKNKILLFIAFVFISFTSFAQISKDTLYQSDSWWPIKLDNLYRDYAGPDTMDYSIHEKVEILKSGRTFKVTIGEKVNEYMILSSKRLTNSSVASVQYVVSLNGREGELNVSDMKNGSYYVNIDWEIGSMLVQASPLKP